MTLTRIIWLSLALSLVLVGAIPGEWSQPPAQPVALGIDDIDILGHELGATHILEVWWPVTGELASPHWSPWRKEQIPIKGRAKRPLRDRRGVVYYVDLRTGAEGWLSSGVQYHVRPIRAL